VGLVACVLTIGKFGLRLPELDYSRTTMTQQELLQEFCVSLNEEASASLRGLFELGIIKFELRQDGDINQSLTVFGRLVLAQIRKESIC
jgi:hypothetical protein